MPVAQHIAGSCVLLGVILAACAPPAPPRPAAVIPQDHADIVRQPKRITVGVRGTAQVLYNKLNIGNAGLGVVEVERLIHTGLAVQDERGALHAVLAMLTLYYVVEPTMIANRLANVGARPNGTTQAWNAHEWAYGVRSRES